MFEAIGKNRTHSILSKLGLLGIKELYRTSWVITYEIEHNTFLYYFIEEKTSIISGGKAFMNDGFFTVSKSTLFDRYKDDVYLRTRNSDINIVSKYKSPRINLQDVNDFVLLYNYDYTKLWVVAQSGNKREVPIDKLDPFGTVGLRIKQEGNNIFRLSDNKATSSINLVFSRF